MKLHFKIFSIIVILSNLQACTPSPPYEITSPCVAADPENPYAIVPCTRVPANLKYSIV